MGRRCALFTETDLKRALKVVRDAGLAESTRIVITRQGDIAIELTTAKQLSAPEEVTAETPLDAPHLTVVPEDLISL